MHDALIRKLEGVEALSDQDRRVLNGLMPRVRRVGAHVDLIREGEVPENVHLILDGFACRYKVLPDGERQVMAYLIPGDFCDLNVFILDQMDHNIGTLSPCQVVDIPRRSIDEITPTSPGRSDGAPSSTRRSCASGWSTSAGGPRTNASPTSCASS